MDLLFEDAAVLHHIPFAREALGGALRGARLPEPVCESWLAALPGLHLRSSGPDGLRGEPSPGLRQELAHAFDA